MSYSTFSKIDHHSVCLICAIQKIVYVKNRNYLENVRLRRHRCRSRLCKKIGNFIFQISRFWVYRPNDVILRPSKFLSRGSISMRQCPFDPRCWWSKHIYIGYLHPKYNFDISHKNWNYKISSWSVYFYRAR